MNNALNERQYQLNRFFPDNASNWGFEIPGVSSHAPFCTLALDDVPDRHMIDTGLFIGRYRYEPIEDSGMLDLGGDGEVVNGYRRIDNITDDALKKFRAAYGNKITKDDIFYYVYGLLHSPEYRKTYAADLKKMLPRIPLVTDAKPFINAGCKLAELHLGYETVKPYPLHGMPTALVGDPYEFYRVEKMAFVKVREDGKLVADKSTIKYNPKITLSGIPADAYRYMLGSRSAIEWIIDRYQVKTDKASGITNDPNDWSKEVGNPHYILDLLARIVTVSIETMKLVDALPPLSIHPEQSR